MTNLRTLYSTKYLYAILGLTSGFVLSLIGITVEDIQHQIPLAYSLSEWPHYITPSLLGILFGISGLALGKKTVQNRNALNNILALQEKYKAMFSNISDAITIIGENGIIIFQSSNYQRHFGCQSSKMLGKEFSAAVHPDDLEHFQRTLSSLKQTKNSTFELELQYKCKDGNFKTIYLRAINMLDNPNINGFLLSYHDVSAKVEAFKELERSEKKYHNLFENMPDIVCILDNKGNIVDLNQKGIDLYGYTKEEILKMPLDQLIYKGDKEESDSYFTELKDQGTYEMYEGRIITKTGKIVWIQVNSTAITKNGVQVGSQDIIRDITKRKEIESTLVQTTEKLKKLNAEKNKFFSIIAHDLRSPFNGFLGLTQIMAEDLPSLSMTQIQEIAIRLQVSSSNLFNLLENLLQWANSHQGLITFSPQPLQLSTIVNETTAIISETAKSKKIEISTEIPENISVKADKNMLQTILRNLLSNAVKFTKKGGKVQIASKAINDTLIEISIQDSGIGMNQYLMDNLFRLDIQTNKKGTDGEPSTGLGLLLCKEFIEKHGGIIRVQSKENQGSIFYFTIPLSA